MFKVLGRNLIFVGIIILISFKTNASGAESENTSANQSNVIMFIMDDLNDWVTPLGYKQVITPNLDRLAKLGVTFKNAHAPGVFCAPF